MPAKPIPPEVIADIEAAVAEALNLEDLARAVDALLPARTALPADHDEVDLIVAWVWINRSAGWPAWLREDAERERISGQVIAAVLAHDLYAGREPGQRPLNRRRRHLLQAWEREVTGD